MDNGPIQYPEETKLEDVDNVFYNGEKAPEQFGYGDQEPDEDRFEDGIEERLIGTDPTDVWRSLQKEVEELRALSPAEITANVIERTEVLTGGPLLVVPPPDEPLGPLCMIDREDIEWVEADDVWWLQDVDSAEIDQDAPVDMAEAGVQWIES